MTKFIKQRCRVAEQLGIVFSKSTASPRKIGKVVILRSESRLSGRSETEFSLKNPAFCSQIAGFYSKALDFK